MAILGIIVVIPLCSLVVFSARLSLSEFWQTITRPRVLSSYAVKSILLTLKVVVITVVVNTIFRTLCRVAHNQIHLPGQKRSYQRSSICRLPYPRSSRALYSYLHLAGRASFIHTLKSSGYRYSHRSHSPTYAGLCCTELYCAPQGPWVKFGAVSVLSGHLRGLTNTMPLYIELLY